MVNSPFTIHHSLLLKMKILIVCSKNSGNIAPFIVEQVDSLIKAGFLMDYFTIESKCWKGYLKSRKSLLSKIKEFKPDLIHAHYGLSGLLANLQRRVPVVTTYHGSDINDRRVYPFSRLCMMVSKQNIFVSKNIAFKSLKRDLKNRKNYSLIPCGVDINLFVPMDKEKARQKLKLDVGKQYVLFAGSFANGVKNPALAMEAAALIPEITLLELKGYTREEVSLLMNAVDAVLMTSFTEGSPQFIKESMACNCPVVSVPVGDVQEEIEGVAGCYITSYEPDDVVKKIKLALDFSQRTNGRQRILERELNLETVAKKIAGIYRKVISLQ